MGLRGAAPRELLQPAGRQETQRRVVGSELERSGDVREGAQRVPAEQVLAALLLVRLDEAAVGDRGVLVGASGEEEEADRGGRQHDEGGGEEPAAHAFPACGELGAHVDERLFDGRQRGGPRGCAEAVLVERVALPE